jgi:hypothetical protein
MIYPFAIRNNRFLKKLTANPKDFYPKARCEASGSLPSGDGFACIFHSSFAR